MDANRRARVAMRLSAGPAIVKPNFGLANEGRNRPPMRDHSAVAPPTQYHALDHALDHVLDHVLATPRVGVTPPQ